jgi:hypothetical protein
MLLHTLEGTRVVLLPSEAAGVIVDVRWETWLKPYAVLRDDGRRVYASACDLAREDDPTRTPLGPPVHA